MRSIIDRSVFCRRKAFRRVGAYAPLLDDYRVDVDEERALIDALLKGNQTADDAAVGNAFWYRLVTADVTPDHGEAEFWFPADNHCCYAIALMEFDFAAVLGGEERFRDSFLAVADLGESVTLKCNGSSRELPLYAMTICVNRASFPPLDHEQAKENPATVAAWRQNVCAPRADRVAHEIHYVEQYAGNLYDVGLVDRNGGIVSPEHLERGIEEPMPDHDKDLVCSFVTVDRLRRRFFPRVKGLADFTKLDGSSIALRNYFEEWLMRYSVGASTAHERTMLWLEQELHDVNRFMDRLESHRDGCRQSPKYKETFQAGTRDGNGKCLSCADRLHLIAGLRKSSASSDAKAWDVEILDYLLHLHSHG